VKSSPAIGSNGGVYIGSIDHQLYAFTSAGALLWSYAAGGEVKSSPAIGSDGGVYVASYDMRLYCIRQVPPTVTPTPTITGTPTQTSSGTPTFTPTDTPTPAPTATPYFFVPLNIRLGHNVQPPAGVLSIFADITVKGTAYAGVQCRPFLAVSVGGKLYYIVSGNKLVTKSTPYVSNGKGKYFKLYDNILNYDAAEIPFSGIAPGRYWVYGALFGKNGSPLGPIAERVITIE
jgi:outer membrane protein assembly factor BamB